MYRSKKKSNKAFLSTIFNTFCNKRGIVLALSHYNCEFEF